MMNINFYVKSIESLIILNVMWYERFTKYYLLHTDSSEFRELGKTCQATRFPLSILNHWSFTEHTLALQTTTLKIPPLRLMSRNKMRCCAMSSNYGLWWDYIAMSFGPWASALFCEYGLFWALEEIFPKSMIVLIWCRSPMKWNHVMWKFFPQQGIRK